MSARRSQQEARWTLECQFLSTIASLLASEDKPRDRHVVLPGVSTMAAASDRQVVDVTRGRRQTPIICGASFSRLPPQRAVLRLRKQIPWLRRPMPMQTRRLVSFLQRQALAPHCRLAEGQACLRASLPAQGYPIARPFAPSSLYSAGFPRLALARVGDVETCCLDLSTSVPMADRFRLMSKSPSQWPGIRQRSLDIRTGLQSRRNAPVGFRSGHLLRVFQPGHFHG